MADIAFACLTGAQLVQTGVSNKKQRKFEDEQRKASEKFEHEERLQAQQFESE